MKYVDLVFGVTPARCYFAEEELGVPHNKTRLLPIGADEDEADKILSGEEREISKLPYSSAPIEVVTGGKWFKGKGLEELIQAVRGLDIKLNIFGKVEDAFIDALISEAPDNVTFVGWQDRLGTLRLLKEADLAIWPRQHTTLVEDAVATRTPLILRYHGSTSHFIRGNGAYLFTGETNEIRQTLSLLSRSRDLIVNMKANTDKILDLLSYNRVARESIEYYKNQDPKETHEFFMNDPLCDPKTNGFYRLT
jgi:glycosyltransferase involved in cell wall biosynthesis